LHTALITAGILDYALEKVVMNPLLYGETLEEVLQVVKCTENQYNSLFIFGHNPIFTDLPNLFLIQPIDNLPTSGAVIFKFETNSWKEISKKSVKSEMVLTPKNL
jgi:phosphohistidine phosphatase